uniref:Brain-enriched guanylate kinase-associated protein n=1 Tax=Cyprinodon variegatus TaxID=28743 RepID=A0A3Q2EA83_CYPVA
ALPNTHQTHFFRRVARAAEVSFHDHKDDLRKRLSYTTHKLEMVETEFDSTRQYLETELRRAQEELEKFTEKLRRIQSGYSALQRINQDLEDKICRTVGETAPYFILTILKYTGNKISFTYPPFFGFSSPQLPLDFQERINSYMEKHSRGRGATIAMCHPNYPEEVPTAVIAKVLEKLEPGSDSPITCSSSSHVQDGDFLIGTGSNDHLNRRISYKSSDLYCSDTALYCPERWQDTERRQSVDLHDTGLLQLHAQTSLESNPDDDPFQSGSFSHHDPPSSFHHHEEFGTGSFPASSSYSSFSLASDEKGTVSGGGGRTTNSALSSSHQGLYMDWRDGVSGDYDHKSLSSYDKQNPGFSKSHSVQRLVSTRSPQKGMSPSYTRTASCFSEPYHSSSPRLASSHSMGSTAGLGQAQGGALDSRNDIQVPEDDLSIRWKQLSVEDIHSFSSYRNMAGRISPYSFSEQQFAMGPSSKHKESLYSSFQEGDDVFHGHVLDHCFSVGSPSPSQNPKPKDGGATSANSTKKDYVNLGVDSSAESLHHSSLEASSLQHYPAPRPTIRPRPSSSSALSTGPALPKKTSPRYKKFGSTGLTRKDSLTKAQLYGTLLN